MFNFATSKQNRGTDLARILTRSDLVRTLTKSVPKGVITTYVLVFGAIFLILLAGLLGFILLQLRHSAQKAAWNQALHIAEAGINYYRWCLNNEISQNCDLEKNYEDLSGNIIGKFQIQLDTTSNCGLTISQKIISTGWTLKYPDLKRKVTVFYGRESVAKYSYILNSNVWVGSDHIIRGPYHSNGGVRFDGQNQSIVSSGQENWVCTSSFGCGPKGVGYGFGLCPSECQIISKQCVCPGVFSTTQNSNRDLFSFPIPPFDFNAVTTDLAQIKNAAQNLGGIYLPPSNTINFQGKGWRLIFQSAGQVEARIITSLSSTYSYSIEEGYHYDYLTITSEYTYNTYTISSSCSVIFVEDNLWPEGTTKGKVTVASANLIDANKDTDVILQANLDYTTTDGSDGLTLIGENRVLIGPNSPDYMTLRGIFVAQKGRFSRNHYKKNIRQSLKIYGSIISNGRVGTKWINQGGHIISGYRERETYVDPYLLYQPPTFTPFISSEFKIVKWEEL